MDLLPDEIMNHQPWLNVTNGWAAVYTGRLDAVEPLLQHAEQTLAQTAHEHIPVNERDHISGHITAVRAYTAELRGDLSQAESNAREALILLPEDDLMARGSAATVLGAALRWSGDFEGAKQALNQASIVSHASGNNHIVMFIQAGLAQIKVYQGRLGEAAAEFEEVLRTSGASLQHRGRTPPVSGYIHTRLSWIYREWNDLEKALHYARQGLKLSKTWGQADVLMYGYVNLARALLAAGDTGEALKTIKEARKVAIDVSGLDLVK